MCCGDSPLQVRAAAPVLTSLPLRSPPQPTLRASLTHSPPPLWLPGEATTPWSAPNPTLAAFPDATALLHVARAAHVRAFSPESLTMSPTHTRLRVAPMHLQPEASRSQVGAGAAGAQAARHSARSRGAEAAEAELSADAGALGCAATGGGADLF